MIPSRVSKKSVKKYTPITGCTKEPREICAPAGCGFKKVLNKLILHIFVSHAYSSTRDHWNAMTKFRLWCRMPQRSSAVLNLKERASMWQSWCRNWSQLKSVWTCQRRFAQGREPIPGRWRSLLWRNGAMSPLRSLAWHKPNFPTPKQILAKKAIPHGNSCNSRSLTQNPYLNLHQWRIHLNRTITSEENDL